MRVFLSRWVCLDVESNLARMALEARGAAAAGAELVVFPELFLTGYTRALEPQQAHDAFAAVSSELPNTTFVFGSLSKAQHNATTVWRAGREIASYDKVHLFAPNNEQRLWQPGKRYVAVQVGSHVLGLLCCNDLRFPEQARALRLEAHADVLVIVAWWPWRRDWVWRTLLQARAIENATWVVGCCVAASEWPGESFAGAGNYVFDPVGEPVPTLDDHTYELAPARAAAVLVDPLHTFVPVTEVKVYGEKDLHGSA